MGASQYGRLWLVGLLFLTALVAGGALFAKYQLEGLRSVILDTAQARTGGGLRVDSISAFGLRGLRAEGLHLSYAAPPGVSIELEVPEALIYIDLIDLFSGNISVEHIQLDGANLTLRREEGQTWLSGEQAGIAGSSLSPVSFPFRVTGRGCRLQIENVVRNTELELGDVDVDVSRLSGSPTLTGEVSGNLSDREDKRVKLGLQFTSLADFEFSIQCAQLTADDVNIFLPASQHILRSGIASPTLRLDGNPDKTVSLALESGFSGIEVRNQPEYLPPVTGLLTAYGTYDPATRVLRLSMAKAESDTLEGNVTGTIVFGDGPPALDLRLTSSLLPVKEIVNSLLEGRVDSYGDLQYSVQAMEECALTVAGTTEAPVIRASASAAGGELSFVPKDRNLPRAGLKLGHFEVAWDSASQQPSGAISIVDGSVRHPGLGLEASGIVGRITIADGIIDINPLNATFLGQALVASATYSFEDKSGEATFAGAFTGIESTKLAQFIRNTTFAGGGSVKGAKVKYRKSKVDFEADVDATQTEIGYRWWFLKPVGIGASAHLTGQFVPRKAITCALEGLVAGTQLSATASLGFNGKRWRLRSARAESSEVDVVSVGKCLPLPYTITGGSGKDGLYEWNRDDKQEDRWSSRFACMIDELAVRAQGSDYPIAFKGVKLEGGLAYGASDTGDLTLTANSVVTPALRGTKWFAPMERDREKYPPSERRWTYHLKAKSLEVPPWKGKDFSGEGYGTLTETGLSHYEAGVDEGRVEGSYLSNRTENSYESTAKWDNVSATYLMDTLNLPHVFRGLMSGEISYSQDRDDPGTLRGTGYFKMNDGQFSADYLLAMLERQMDSEVSALPPSLRFSSLEADVDFEKDIVRTPRIHLTSDAIKLDGKGQFVTDGDMNYEIKVAVTPDAAERIPLLADNFNVQGYRLAQQDIELAFRLSGPTLRPVSSLAETPPVHVTLVSGALEAANEAMRVFDAPRKILVDLLKIGGGLVGARKQPQSGSTN